MERINKIRNKKQQFIANKASKFFSSTSILKLSIALALFFIAAFMISGAGITAEDGALNVSNNLLVNANTLFADSANNRVGIGTASPGKLLTLKSDSGQLRIETSSDSANYYTLLHSSYNSNHPFNLSVANGGVLAEYLGVYADGGTNNRVVFPTGSVGIGTSSPTAALDVRSAVSIGANAATTGHIRLPAEAYLYARNAANTGNYFIFGQSADDLYFGHTNPNIYFRTDDGSTRMTIETGGDVGIGTTSPASALTVVGNFSATGTKAAVINTSQGPIAFYAMESTEVRLYDEGKASLANGIATVNLDPIFAEVIDTSDYLVYVTPKGSSNGLFIEQQAPTSFVVKENNGGRSSIEFNYLISGKRKEFKGVRLYRMADFDFGGKTANLTTT